MRPTVLYTGIIWVWLYVDWKWCILRNGRFHRETYDKSVNDYQFHESGMSNLFRLTAEIYSVDLDLLLQDVCRRENDEPVDGMGRPDNVRSNSRDKRKIHRCYNMLHL